MAGGNPKYGGTNGVSLLDVGQIGGTRDSAGDATFTLRGLPAADQAIVVEHRAAQQGGLIQDNLGYAGSAMRWSGLLVARNVDILRTIARELNQKLHGQLRNSSNGTMGPVDPVQLRETQLTDYDGAVLSDRARLIGWSVTGERGTTPDGKVVVGLDVEFRIL